LEKLLDQLSQRDLALTRLPCDADPGTAVGLADPTPSFAREVPVSLIGTTRYKYKRFQ